MAICCVVSRACVLTYDRNPPGMVRASRSLPVRSARKTTPTTISQPERLASDALLRHLQGTQDNDEIRAVGAARFLDRLQHPNTRTGSSLGKRSLNQGMKTSKAPPKLPAMPRSHDHHNLRSLNSGALGLADGLHLQPTDPGKTPLVSCCFPHRQASIP
jgi:hypothetical protein